MELAIIGSAESTTCQKEFRRICLCSDKNGQQTKKMYPAYNEDA